MGNHFFLQGTFPTQISNPESLFSLALTGGFLTTTPSSQVHTALSCSLVFIWGIGNTHRKNYRTSNFRLRNVSEVTQDPRVLEPEGPQTRAPPGWLGPAGPGSTHREAELPGHPLPEGALGTCVSFTVPKSPGLGRAWPPQPLSAAGCGLGVPPAAFGGLEATAGSCRGR